MPAAPSRPVITIVGGGFAGTALALALARQPGTLNTDLYLVEPRPAPGPGLAYSAERPEYLLNVRPGALSVRPDEPAHFAAWLAAQPESAAGAPEFAARATYGRYLHQTLASVLDQQQPNGSLLRWHQQEAMAAPLLPDGRRAVQLTDGRQLISDYVVLALGNFPPPPPTGPDQRYLTHPGYHGDPWAPGLLAGIGSADSVLLIGAGLTAVDVLLALRRAGHQAPITVVARHGRWPAVHRPAAAPYPPFYAELAGLTTVREVLAVVRRHVRQAGARGLDWRPVIDALRPDLGRIWAAWPLAEQARFLRHLGSSWSVLRHRSPPQNAAAIAEMEAAGQVRLCRGRVWAVEPCGAKLRIQVGAGLATADGWQRARHVINCTGPLLDYERIQAPLVQGLRAAGELTPDPLGLGILTDLHGALLRADGQASTNLFTLGASRRPAYFESTAVPELRQQAAELATELSRQLSK